MRTFFESVRVALDMLRMYKLRAFLTMLGVIIGVMSVTMIIMVRNGFHHYMTNEISKLGARTLFIAFDPGRGRRGESLGSIEGLKNDDVQYLLDRVESLEIASAILQVPSQTVTFGDRELDDPRIFATDEKQAKLSQVTILEGRMLTKSDQDSLANVAVIGEDVRDRLFRGESVLGQWITFDGISLEVIGVMKKIEILGQDTGRDIWVPISTAQLKWVGGDSISFITALPKDGVEVEQAMDDVWQALMAKSNNKPIYRVDSREAILNILGGLVNAVGLILIGIASLSLLVGGIGIMNIMLVSVTERMREIGLRKAVGAKPAVIAWQFLVESAFLSLVGGLIGMGIAYGFGMTLTAITKSLEWPTSEGLLTPFPVGAAIAAALFSALIGVIFGLYPAGRAARLSPIEALRSE